MARSILIAAAALATALSTADQHLLAGARLFRDGQFEKAYVEFRVAERLGSGGEATWYAAASLARLDRHEDAVEAFAIASRAAPGTADAVLDYYRALAFYGARLYVRADELLATVPGRAGPKIAAQAARIRADIRPLFTYAPPATSIDFYVARGSQMLEAGRSELAAEYFQEAASLAALRADRGRAAEAQRLLGQARAGKGPKKP